MAPSRIPIINSYMEIYGPVSLGLEQPGVIFSMSDCNSEIMTMIEARLAKGRKEYGHGLVQNSGYDWVKEALEEALDMSIYLSAKLIEIQNKSAQK